MIKRRPLFWFFFFSMLLFPLFVLLQITKEMANSLSSGKPDIILITIDTCRADALGIYGNEKVKTPWIDFLSRKSVVFTKGYAPIPTTAPSHATLLTGKLPSEHKVFTNGIKYSGKYTTIAQALKKCGYKTAAFISGYSLVNRVSGLGYGFDYYSDEWSKTQLEQRANETLNKFLIWYYKNKDAPLFAWIHFFDPHSPYNPPEIYKKLYDNQSSPLDNINNKKAEIYSKNVENALKSKDFKVLVKDTTTTKTDKNTLDRFYKLYLGEISFVDSIIGKLIIELKSNGKFEKSVLVLTADHGEGFDHDYFFGHGDRLWESSVRVPWLIKFQLNSYAPFISNTVVRHEDLFPTLINQVKCKNKISNYIGEDLKQLITKGIPRKNLIWFTSAPPLPRKSTSKGLLVAVYSQRYKMIYEYNTGKEELFDLEKDPGETNDISKISPKIYKRFSAILKHHISKSGYPVESKLPDANINDIQKLKELGYIE